MGECWVDVRSRCYSRMSPCCCSVRSLPLGTGCADGGNHRLCERGQRVSSWNSMGAAANRPGQRGRATSASRSMNHSDHNHRSKRAGVELVERLSRVGVPARLFGGIAIELLTPWERVFGFERPLKDIDIVVPLAMMRSALRRIADGGWSIDARSALFGALRRVRAKDESSGIELDVFSDPLELCHRLKVGGRLSTLPLTLSRADLFLSKAQIREPTERDVMDMIALLCHCSIEEPSFDVDHLANTAAESWGWWYSIHLALMSIRKLVSTKSPLLPSLAEEVGTLVAQLEDEVWRHRKSLSWKVRSLFGTRLPWSRIVE